MDRKRTEQSSFEIQAGFCRAMGHPVRLHILHVLREAPMHVGELARQRGLSQPAVSRQLAVLRSAGVVSCRRCGIEMVYQLSDSKVGEVCDLVRRVLFEDSLRYSKIIGE